MNQNDRKGLATGIIIGIGGVTNGGKSTLCRKLEQELPNTGFLCMDDFFWPEDSPNHRMLPEFNYANWDELGAVNFPGMVQAIERWQEKAQFDAGANNNNIPVLLVEGILIFNNRELRNHLHKKYFFTLTKEQCWERRSKRTYLPPEPEGYFDKICWPEYVKYKDMITDQAEIVYVDAALPQEDVYDRVVQDIQALRNKMSESIERHI